jgi:carbon-monoxide dehydrogenase medium subunit
MDEFKYISPTSLDETLALISEYKGRAKVIAGGTDILAKLKKGLPLPEILINIEGVRDLDYIKYDIAGGLSIGAATPVASLECSPLIKSRFPVLSQAAAMLGSPVIRSRATIGGNICNAAPSADTAPALMALGARIRITGRDGETVVPLENFFAGPGETVLKPGHILVEIQVPEMPPVSGAAYIKQKRRAGADLAVAGVAVMITLENESGITGSSPSVDMTNSVLKDVRIVLGAVAPTPIRAIEAENILRGQKISGELMTEAGQAAADASRPINDGRSTADYRKKLVAVLVPRAIKQALEQIKTEV